MERERSVRETERDGERGGISEREIESERERRRHGGQA